jgi:hypothetical protein
MHDSLVFMEQIQGTIPCHNIKGSVSKLETSDL